MSKIKDEPKGVTETQKNRMFVNVPFSTPEELELREKLEIMVKDHGSDNAKFIRLLIAERWVQEQQVKRTIEQMKKRGVWQQ